MLRTTQTRKSFDTIPSALLTRRVLVWLYRELLPFHPALWYGGVHYRLYGGLSLVGSMVPSYCALYYGLYYGLRLGSLMGYYGLYGGLCHKLYLVGALWCALRWAL